MFSRILLRMTKGAEETISELIPIIPFLVAHVQSDSDDFLE